MGIAIAVNKMFELIILVLFVKILLTWFPNINWHNEPFRSLKAFSDLFFAPLRKVIPPVGMLDISPIFTFILLSVIRNVVVSLLISLGL